MPSLPTELVSHEMYSIVFVLFFLFSCLLGVAVFFVKKWFERVEDNIARILIKMEYMNDQRTTCREELPSKYDDKGDTNTNLLGAWSKINPHDSRISVLESTVG